MQLVSLLLLFSLIFISCKTSNTNDSENNKQNSKENSIVESEDQRGWKFWKPIDKTRSTLGLVEAQSDLQREFTFILCESTESFKLNQDNLHLKPKTEFLNLIKEECSFPIYDRHKSTYFFTSEKLDFLKKKMNLLEDNEICQLKTYGHTVEKSRCQKTTYEEIQLLFLKNGKVKEIDRDRFELHLNYLEKAFYEFISE